VVPLIIVTLITMRNKKLILLINYKRDNFLYVYVGQFYKYVEVCHTQLKKKKITLYQRKENISLLASENISLLASECYNKIMKN